jgi:hypothetical protein
VDKMMAKTVAVMTSVYHGKSHPWKALCNAGSFNRSLHMCIPATNRPSGAVKQFPKHGSDKRRGLVEVSLLPDSSSTVGALDRCRT